MESLECPCAGNVEPVTWGSIPGKIITLIEFQGPGKDHRQVVKTPKRVGTSCTVLGVSSLKGQKLT